MTGLVATAVRQAIPAHLRPYVAVQHYDGYTPVNHAVWRYVMRRNMAHLERAAHPAYRAGLGAAGISVDAIPDVDDMHRQLSEVGWGAVVVDGLIPSVAFFDFQARGLLPISVDIRTLQHIEYTPAPDIIHEAAGHAPFLADERFGNFVKQFGRIGAKALGTQAGHDVFDALRHLTILMESPHATAAEIAEAERQLALQRQVPRPESEESWVSRLYWWTVEYGLIGDVQNPRIYGAGLLSSVSEGKHCLTDAVRKLPFDLETCIQTRYDVTKPQPQLFVCTDFDELAAAAERLSERMAFRVGGTESLLKAVQSGRTATVVYSSGLQVSGTFTNVRRAANGEGVYLQTTGATALAVADQQLSDHGRAVHGHGFGSPIGRLQGEAKPLETFDEADLERTGIRPGYTATLRFEGGVNVSGRVERILRQDGRIVLISFAQCSVTCHGETLFAPTWGMYDMAVGATITSVYAGAADAQAYFTDVSKPAQPGKSETAFEGAMLQSPGPEEVALNQLYQMVRDVREGHADEVVLCDVTAQLDRSFPHDWLLRLEILEVLLCHGIHNDVTRRLHRRLVALQADEALQDRIASGLDLLPLSALTAGAREAGAVEVGGMEVGGMEVGGMEVGVGERTVG